MEQKEKGGAPSAGRHVTRATGGSGDQWPPMEQMVVFETG